MIDSKNTAREWLAGMIKLEPAKLSDIRAYIYNYKSLEGCDLFYIAENKIGSSTYIAVPNNGDTPFFLGKLGE